MAASASNFMDFQVIHPSFVGFSKTPAYFAIRSRDELETWAKQPLNDDVSQMPRGAPRLPLPHIDFDHFTLLIANAGTKGSSGFSVAFTSVFSLPSAIYANVVEIAPTGTTCAIMSIETHPVALVLIPKTDQPIQFNVSTARTDCAEDRIIKV